MKIINRGWIEKKLKFKKSVHWTVPTKTIYFLALCWDWFMKHRGRAHRVMTDHALLKWSEILKTIAISTLKPYIFLFKNNLNRTYKEGPNGHAWHIFYGSIFLCLYWWTVILNYLLVKDNRFYFLSIPPRSNTCKSRTSALFYDAKFSSEQYWPMGLLFEVRVKI